MKNLIQSYSPLLTDQPMVVNKLSNGWAEIFSYMYILELALPIILSLSVKQ